MVVLAGVGSADHMITKSPSRKTRLFPPGPQCGPVFVDPAPEIEGLERLHTVCVSTRYSRMLRAQIRGDDPLEERCNDHRPVHAVTTAMLLAALLTIAAGCSHMLTRIGRSTASLRRAHDSPRAGSTTPDGVDMDFPQYWKGNTLVVDMRLAGGQGGAVLKPREHTVWPVRIAFRVMPAQFGALEVRAAQRVVLPITTTGTKPVDLDLSPGVFIMKSLRSPFRGARQYALALLDQSSGS